MHARTRCPEKVRPLVGTCMQFCPPQETKRRKVQRSLHRLEVISHEHTSIVPVKEYVRAGAGHTAPDPDDLRPPSVLVATINYLISHVSGRTDLPWWVVYEFVCNRIQSIRQDITYQQLDGPEVEYILQVAVRFHLYSQYRLWTAPLKNFDKKLNNDQLQQCLAKLLKQSRQQKWIPEFEAFHLLTNLGNPQATLHAIELDSDMRHRPRLATALRVNRTFTENNFVSCFRLIYKLSPLEQAAVLPFVHTLRRSALEILNKAYYSKNGTFPVSTLLSWLLVLDSKQMTEYCTELGIQVIEGNLWFRKGGLAITSQEQKLGLPVDRLFNGSVEPYRFILTPPPINHIIGSF